MKVKIKKLSENSILPSYSKSGDAGMDLTAVSRIFDKDGNVSYGTGLSFEIPEGYVGLLFPRSSNSKQDLLLSNSVGVLDSGYRGEVFFKFKPSAIYVDNEEGLDEEGESFDFVSLPNDGYAQDRFYKIGERVGQLIILPYPQIEFEEVDKLTDTERGEGGFGHTGK